MLIFKTVRRKWMNKVRYLTIMKIPQDLKEVKKIQTSLRREMAINRSMFFLAT